MFSASSSGGCSGPPLKKLKQTLLLSFARPPTTGKEDSKQGEVLLCLTLK